jgi:hypothetical protein
MSGYVEIVRYQKSDIVDGSPVRLSYADLPKAFAYCLANFEDKLQKIMDRYKYNQISDKIYPPNKVDEPIDMRRVAGEVVSLAQKRKDNDEH